MTMKLLKTCGASLAAITLGLSLVATPAMARGGGGGGGDFHGGGGGFGGNGLHGGGGGFGGNGFHGGDDHHGGFGGGYYGGYDAGLGLGLLATAPYYGYGAYYDAPNPYYGTTPAPGNDVAYCEAHYKSYNPSTGTYLGYDGQRHACP